MYAFCSNEPLVQPHSNDSSVMLSLILIVIIMSLCFVCTLQALEDEGHDPNTIEMEVVDSPVSKKTPIRKTPKSKSDGMSGWLLY